MTSHGPECRLLTHTDGQVGRSRRRTSHKMNVRPSLLLSGVLFFYFLPVESSGDSGITELKVRIDGQEVDLGIPGFNSPEQNTTLRMNEDFEFVQDLDNIKDSELLQNELIKRLRRSSVMQYDRKGPACFNRLEKMKQGAKNMAVQYAILVDKGQTAQMTCHFCQDETTDKFKPMNWYKLNRAQDGYYRFNEIGLDMHDNPKKNRRSKTVDHTLTIKRATENDVGSYFCHDFKKADRLIGRIMDADDIKSILSDTSSFRFLYHLDVMRSSDAEIKEVDHNLRLITEWQKWGPCSKCGQPGVRKRLGLCIVEKKDVKYKCSPWFVESVMASNPTGIPCRSTIFTNHINVDHRSDEIVKEPCVERCTKKKKKETSNVAKLNDVMFRKQKVGFAGNAVRVIYGRELKMSCPGANLDTTVTWFFKDKPLEAAALAKRTKGRMTIDIHNVLTIKKLELTDSGKYVCAMNKKKKVEIVLDVFMDNTVELWEYSLYLLATYPINLMIFLSLLVVRHRQYKVGVVLTEKKIKMLEGMSSSESSSDDEF
ncbi:hypothetical protein LOTGIDRAFT_227775 [Lottia gigantea]|uniref:Ig-like domain-containing protein n=1 Tax=Lottia gigantea TaxID=225164 RepID=V4B3T4_LOTGI|nr:hypothetical protein LOTGIDRAFT_227775 [Lottia gigantea]ESP05058.1 hypothetical protein LOTGIDRAFT_227775 [Lottia gigantea]